jgi:hypothetical protein
LLAVAPSDAPHALAALRAAGDAHAAVIGRVVAGAVGIALET